MTLAVQEAKPTGFVDRLEKLLERVEFRRADTREEKEAIFGMRHTAYTREGYIEPQASGLFTDPDDESPNAWLIGVFIDGEIASSLRLHIAARPSQRLPVMSVFPDIVGPRLEAGNIIIDASRHTSRLEYTKAYPQLPYITLRASFLAESYFKAHYITAALRTEYGPVFRRMYNMTEWATPRAYPLLNKPQVLMRYDCFAMRAPIRARYAFLNSRPGEEREVFKHSSNSLIDPYFEITGAVSPGDEGALPLQRSA